MSTMSYRADTSDISFVLFEQLRVQDKLLAYTIFEEHDRETFESVIEEATRLAEGLMSDANRVGDREGVKFDGAGNVSTPDIFKEAWQAIAEGGWIGLASAPELGGSGLPFAIDVCKMELFSGAATAFYMYPGLTAGAAGVIADYAPPALRELVANKLYSGEWGGTMCLTEAGAGSDVGANRASADPTDAPGVYLLEGEKIFISGGDQDLTANIMHLVLARTPGAPAGTKGLSIFMVPKFDFDTEGELGARNGAVVSGIEHKMGINGSATCSLVLGGERPCKGYLMGTEGEGMPIMFHMMNEARIGVAIQGLGLAAHAYGNAVSYCKERKQGASIDKFRDAGAPRIEIQLHPDVRRMLLLQKCQVEAMRSLIYRVGMLADVAAHDPDEATRKHAHHTVDLLTPIAKAHCTDVGFECAVQALQCLGGYGFTSEYPVEQHVRDAKIGSIYEGTNGIQAMDLVGRKMRLGGGQVFMGWLQEANGTVAAAKAAGLGDEAVRMEKALGHLGATAMHLAGLGGQGKLAETMLAATPFLRLFGTVVLGLEGLDQAVIAKGLIEGGADTPHLQGKLVNTRFYTRQVLPAAIALAKSIQDDDAAVLDEALIF